MCEALVCVGCLVTDVKMFIMDSNDLSTSYQLLTGLQVTSLYPSCKLCWECAALVNKFNAFRLKCERAHTLLQDTYMMHGEVSKQSLHEIDREQCKLITKMSFSEIFYVDNSLDDNKLDNLTSDIINDVKLELYDDDLPLVNLKRKEIDDVKCTDSHVDDDVFNGEYKDDMISENEDEIAEDVKKKKRVTKKKKCVKSSVKSDAPKQIKVQPTGERPYQCEVCNRSYASKKCLRVHKRTHSEEVPFKCATCGQGFTYYSNMLRHKRVHTDVKPYNCDICGKSFKNRSTAKLHLDHVHSKKPWPRRHNRVTICGPVACEQCGKQLISNRAYLIHLKRHHPEGTAKSTKPKNTPIMCELCGKICQDKVRLQLHTYIHTGERPYKCDVCVKSYKTPELLKIHKRTHTKELPYKCDICGQGFTNGANMNRHRAVHTDAKPFSCETCGKRFKYRSNIRSHIEYVHMKKPWPKRDRGKPKATQYVIEQT